jgi:hypothetical protein
MTDKSASTAPFGDVENDTRISQKKQDVNSNDERKVRYGEVTSMWKLQILSRHTMRFLRMQKRMFLPLKECFCRIKQKAVESLISTFRQLYF